MEYRIEKRSSMRIPVMVSTLCLFLVSGCGGGGGGGSSEPATTPTPVSSTPTTVTSRGILTGFGSIFVNGVEFETDSAEIESDDNVASESDLRIGMVITLEGTVDEGGSTGTATSVEYNDKVEGPITSITDNVLIVLGQSIVVDDGTVFDDGIQMLSDLTAGDVIEVSGFLNANGEIVATYVELNDPGGEFELVGTVTNLDTDTSTFDIQNQTIEFSVAVFEDFDSALLADGDQVEVKGSTFDSNGALVATKVELEEDDLGESDEVEFEGLVTRFQSETDFDVSGVTVTTSAATTYEGGSAADLTLNIKVEVEGQIGADGVLLAEKVKIRKLEDTRVEGVVDSVDTNAGQVVVLDITFMVTGSTQLEDDSDLNVIFFGLDDIVVGNYLEIRGKLETDATVTAIRLERDDLDGETSVRGAVQSNNGSVLVIAGVTIQTTSGTEYLDAAGLAMNQADFFTSAVIDVEVKAKGEETNTSEITATELELEDDN
ncbi:MAG: DUF5666 domain-containing protein [bacterium]|nr:hypothetical protein [Gammaproteobacteria bacterium]HIL95025.1 hypothetical protein [Pseudomonadales bacterium]